MPAPLLSRTALLEWFAGVGTMSHAFQHHGVRTHAQAEQDELKQRVLRHFIPLSALDVEEHADLLSTGADILAQIDSSFLALARANFVYFFIINGCCFLF